MAVTITQYAPEYGTFSLTVFREKRLDKAGIWGLWWNSGGKMALSSKAYDEFIDARDKGMLKEFFIKAAPYQIEKPIERQKQLFEGTKPKLI